VEKKPVEIIRNYEKPKKLGKHHCLLCMTGDNKGTTYIIKNKRVVLGRGDTADIKVLDGKCSREHLELVYNNGKYILTDLKSQNGTVVNDLKVTQHILKDSDKVIIGKTVFSYKIIERVEEKADLELVEYEEEEEEEEEEETKTKSSKKGNKQEGNKRILIYGIALLVLAFVFLDDGTSNKKPPPKKKEKKELAQFYTGAKDDLDEDLREKVMAYIHQGRREMREQNYFRAIEQFNMALILHPTSGEVNFLLNKTKQQLDDHIKSIFTKANREAESFKYEESIKQYCAVLLYLQEYPDDERFKDAKKNIEFLEEKLGLEQGESKCY
jgi:pSer/pThr/pTyr-binding forkhead associated (FHA) protein